MQLVLYKPCPSNNLTMQPKPQTIDNLSNSLHQNNTMVMMIILGEALRCALAIVAT